MYLLRSWERYGVEREINKRFPFELNYDRNLIANYKSAFKTNYARNKDLIEFNSGYSLWPR